MTELKNIVQIRHLLVTRAFLFTLQEKVAGDLVIDTTYNIANPLIDSGSLLLNSDYYNSEKIQYFIKDMDTIFFWLSIGFLLNSLYHFNQNYNQNLNQNNINHLERLKKFIPYNEIKSNTSFIITFCVFLLSKNVLPAT